MRPANILISVAILSLVPAAALASEEVGVVRTLKGTASVLRAGADLKVSPGFKLMEGDKLSTGPDGSLGAFMRDDASLSLGPSSEILIERYKFKPADKEYSFLTRLFKGTICYLSGIIGKLSPESVKFETPVATLSIRGTKFGVRVDE